MDDDIKTKVGCNLNHYGAFIESEISSHHPNHFTWAMLCC
jgi:hypothetical protein